MSQSQKQPPKLYNSFRGFLRDYRPGLREFLMGNAQLVETAIKEKLCTPEEASAVLRQGAELLVDLDKREAAGDDVIYVDEWKAFTRVRRKEPANKGGF